MTFDLRRSLWATLPAAFLLAVSAGLWALRQHDLNATARDVAQDRERLAVGLLAEAAGRNEKFQELLKTLAAHCRGLVYAAVLDAHGKPASAWVAADRAQAALGRKLPPGPQGVHELLLAHKSRRLRVYRAKIEGGRTLQVGFLTPAKMTAPWWWAVGGAFFLLCLALVAGLSRKGPSRATERLRKALRSRAVEPPASPEELLESAVQELTKDEKALKQVEPFFATSIYARLREGRKLGSDERAVAILALRLQGVEKLYEDHPPAKVLDLVNAHFDPILQVLLSHGAVVGTLGPKGLLAWWGAPEDAVNPEERACSAATDIRRALFECHRRQQTVGAPILHAGMGIAVGRCVLGRVGSLQRMEIALIGRAVDQALRLSKVAGAEEILLTATAANLLASGSWRIEALSAPGSRGPDERIWRLLASG